MIRGTIQHNESDAALLRARSSMDIDRPHVDPSILGVPQGWEDDLSVHGPGDSAIRPFPRPSKHMTPLRHRVKLASLAPKSRQTNPILSIRSDVAHVSTVILPRTIHTDPKDVMSAFTSSEGSVEPANKALEQCPPSYRSSRLFETGRKKRKCGESAYCVGYERDVLDAEARLHETMAVLLDKHCLATFEQAPKRILDLGTGLGLWPLSIASVWPDTKIVGFDRALHQVDSSLFGGYRDRITWHQGDFLKPLPFDCESFDYVHMRFVGLGVPEASWPGLLDELCRVLRPGGKLEIIEMSYQHPESSASAQDHFASLLLAKGISEVPARSVNFVLPMLDRFQPQTIKPLRQWDMEAPPVALLEASSTWKLSATNYRSTAQSPSKLSQEACATLGWHGTTPIERGHTLQLTAWVVTRS